MLDSIADFIKYKILKHYPNFITDKSLFLNKYPYYTFCVYIDTKTNSITTMQNHMYWNNDIITGNLNPSKDLFFQADDLMASMRPLNIQPIMAGKAVILAATNKRSNIPSMESMFHFRMFKQLGNRVDFGVM